MISWLGKSNVQIANVSRFNNKLMMMIFFLCHNKQHLGKKNCESWVMTCFAIGCKGCDDKQRWNKRSYIWKRLWQQVWTLTRFLPTMIKPRYAWSKTKYLYSFQILSKIYNFRFKVTLMFLSSLFSYYIFCCTTLKCLEIVHEHQMNCLVIQFVVKRKKYWDWKVRVCLM
jgi:hypothetical protein